MSGGEERREALQRSYDRFQRIVIGLEQAVLETTPAVGEWPVRDVTAHLIDWGEEILLAAEHVLGGPPVPHHPFVDFEAFNVASATRHRADPWPILQARLDDLFARAIAFAGRL